MDNGTIRLSYVSTKYIDFTDSIRPLKKILGRNIYIRKAKLSVEETNEILGLLPDGRKIDYELENIYETSRNNQPDIIISEKCGCFNCKNIYDASEITEFVKENVSDTWECGVCPICGECAVLPDARVTDLDEALLERMHEYFYGRK